MSSLDRLLREWFYIAELCALPVLALFLRHSLLERAKSERSGGRVLLRVVRPRVTRWKSVWLVLSWMIIVGQGAFCVYLVSRPRPASSAELLRNATNYVVILMGIVGSWAAWGRTFLDFREHGFVCGVNFVSWNSIQEWSWSDRVSSLRLKSRNAIATYRLESQDRAAVERVLAEHID